MVDLEDLYQEALGQLPSVPGAKLTLDSTMLASPPHEVACSRLKVVAWNLGRDYGDSARCDVVHFYADPPTYRRLGLLIFASLFHGNRLVRLYPKHPENEIAVVRIGTMVVSNPPWKQGLTTHAASYGYHASPPEHPHPLWEEEWRLAGQKKLGRYPDYFPHLDLTDKNGRCGGSAEQFAERDFVDGFGAAQGTSTLAALLLDIGLPQTKLTDFSLECPSGHWSVALGSAEARFWVGYKER